MRKPGPRDKELFKVMQLAGPESWIEAELLKALYTLMWHSHPGRGKEIHRDLVCSLT